MTSRPVLNIPRSPLDGALEIVAFAGIAFNIIYLIVNWAAIPDIIPIHFDVFGKVDGMGSKLTILLFPSLSLLFYVSLTIVNLFPHTFNYPVPITEQNAYRQYQMALRLMKWLKMQLIWLFAFIEWQIIQAAIRQEFVLNIGFLLVIILVIFATVGYYLWQAYQNR
ncbi:MULTISPECIES: DUF1648 domain-containing protein [Aerosakkonema]|uniref:DUF1648 domain-containing protein n=1 Tax=Aerosakkonema TaxID=1246629 RepID=UPI0035B8C133